MSEDKLIRSCSIWRALEVVGDKPTLLLLESYWLGTRRFSDFHAQTGLLKTVVSDRLQKLMAAGCIDKVLYSEKPKRYEYRGTEKLFSLYPVALTMLHWERRWGRSDGKIGIVLTHARCNEPMEPTPVCRDCRETIDPRDVDWAEGPGVGVMPALYSRRRRSRGAVESAAQTTLFDEIAEIIGDRWSTLIIRSVFTSINSFNEIQDDTQMATNVLTERLTHLMSLGVLRKSDRQADRKVLYKLTAKGRDIYPILLALMEWGDQWYAAEEGPPLILSHRPCRSPLHLDLMCSNCGDGVSYPEIHFEINPAREKNQRAKLA